MSSRASQLDRPVSFMLVLALMVSLVAVAVAAPTAAHADDTPPPPCPPGTGWFDSLGDRVDCVLHEPDIAVLSVDRDTYKLGDIVRFQIHPSLPWCALAFEDPVDPPCVGSLGRTVTGLPHAGATGLQARYVDTQQAAAGPFAMTAVYGEPGCPADHQEAWNVRYTGVRCARLLEHDPPVPLDHPLFQRRAEWIALQFLVYAQVPPEFHLQQIRIEVPIKMDWENDLVAVCEVTPSPTEPGLFHFDATGSSGGEGRLYEWDFGDGNTGTGFVEQHTYTVPGSYTATVTVTDNLDRTATETCGVEVLAPPLTVVLGLPEGGTVSLGEPFEVELHLMAPVSVGGLATLGDLSSVVPVGDEVLRVPEGFEVVEAPEIPDGGLTLEPGAGPTTLSWTLEAAVAGTFTLRSTWEGLDAAGREVGPVEAEVSGGVAGLDVEVEVRYARPPEGSDVEVGPPGFQKDNNGDGVIDAADHRVEVVVTATNRTPETLLGVGPVADEDRVVRFSNQLLGDGQVSLEPIEQPHQVSFGDLEPDVPVERTFVYEAIGQVRAEVRAMLEGVPESGGVVRGVGTADVQLASDLAVEVEIALDDRDYTSGDTVRLSGTVRSLLADEQDESGAVTEEAPEIAVVIFPFVEGNAGNGHISIGGGSSMTPIGWEPIVLGPEEEVDISAILLTQRTEAPSEAKVRYLIQAWEITEDGEPAVEIDQSRIVVSEEGAFSAEHSTSLGAYDFTPDDVRECVTVVIDDIVSCNLYVGIRTLALGLWDLATLIPVGLGEAGNATSRTASWALWMNAQTILAVAGSQVAQQRLVDEIEEQMRTARELGIMADATAGAIGVAVTEFLDEAEEVVESGDGEAMLAFFSRQAGENLDLTVGGVTKLRALAIIQRSNADVAARTTAATAAREARERAAREAQESVEQRVRESRNRGDDPSRDGTFRGNEDVTDIPAVTRGVYGTDTRTLDTVRDIARAEDVLIGWRSRSPIVAELYRLGQIYLKPMDVKAKTVNVIDVNYFGYRRSSMGRVELTEPPIDYRLAAPGNEIAFNNALDGHMATLRSRHPEIAADPLWAAEVRKRLEYRTREYPTQLREFQRYHYEGIKLEFGYDQQGLTGPHAAEVAEIRRAQVKSVVAQGDDGVTRRYLELEMDGPGNNGAFRQIGGDTDIVIIQNPDRTPLTDPAKRRRIYEALQEQMGMQHGETMTYINPEVQAKLLRDHVAGRPGSEALLIAGPDGRVRTGYLEEVFSSRLGPDGEPIGSIFNLVSGAPGELLSSATIGQAVSFPGYLQRLDAYVSRLSFYLPGRLAHLAANLQPEQLFPAFDTDGLLLQPDGQGGVVVYDPDGGPDGGPDGHGSFPDVAPLSEGDDPDGALLDELVDEARDAGLLPDGPPEVGAAGGRWIPIDIEDALDDDGMLALAPMTTLDHDVAAGDTYLPVNDAETMGMTHDGDWFEPGDLIVLDPGGHNEEFATIEALGSLVLTAPLTNDHDAGTAILRLTSSHDGSGDDDGDDTNGGPGSDTGGDPGADTGSSDTGSSDTVSSDTVSSGTGPPDSDPDGTSTQPEGPVTRTGQVTQVAATSTGSLARTGIDLGPLVALAALMLAFGIPLVRPNRRRTGRHMDV